MMSKEFQYSQRPFSSRVTSEQYDLAVGRQAAPTVLDRLSTLMSKHKCTKRCHPGKPDSLESHSVESIPELAQGGYVPAPTCEECGFPMYHILGLNASACSNEQCKGRPE